MGMEFLIVIPNRDARDRLRRGADVQNHAVRQRGIRGLHIVAVNLGGGVESKSTQRDRT